MSDLRQLDLALGPHYVVGGALMFASGTRVGHDDRRKHPRIEIKGTAIVLAGEHAQRGRITNFSEGGLLLSTLTTAPLKLLGKVVDMELRLDGKDAKWLRIQGKIVRIEAQRCALAFDKLPSALLRMADDMAAASRDRRRVLSVILIDEQTSRRGEIAEGFRAVGCNVIEAATSLEAIVRLGESSFEPDLIAVGDSTPAGSADEMREFVAQFHPHVKLLSISDDLAQPAGLAHWLSSSNPDADLVQRIRSILARPRR